MIVFLYGRDSFRLKQNLDKIVDGYHKKYSGLAYTVLDLAERVDFEKLTDLVKTLSFFNEKRLAVVKNAFMLAKETLSLIKEHDLMTDKQRILIFTEQTDKIELSKKDTRLFAALSAELNLVKTFEPLEGKKLETWVAKEATALGCSIETQAIKKLIEYTETGSEKNKKITESWRLHLELEKLANYHYGYKGRPCNCKGAPCIGVADIDLLVTPAEDLNIFELIDAFANRAKFRSIFLLHKNLESGQDPFYIFSMIVYQFRNLLRVKSLLDAAFPYQIIIQKTTLNPFIVKKTFDQCKKYELSELRQLFNQLAAIDVQTKSGIFSMDEALFKFAASI